MFLWKVMYEDIKSYNISIKYLIPMGILLWGYLYFNTLPFFLVVFILFLLFVLIMELLYFFWFKYFNDWFFTKYGGIYDFVWLIWIIATIPNVIKPPIFLSMWIFLCLIGVSYWIWQLMKLYITKPTISNVIFQNKDNLDKIEDIIYDWRYNWSFKLKPLNYNEKLILNKLTDWTPLFWFIFVYFLIFEIYKLF